MILLPIHHWLENIIFNYQSYIFHGLLWVDYDYNFSFFCCYNKASSTANNTIEIENSDESQPNGVDAILNKNYKFKIMLFGGSGTLRGLSQSFTELDIELSVTLSKNS